MIYDHYILILTAVAQLCIIYVTIHWGCLSVQFINVRELRMRSGEIWQQLKSEGYMVITSNGRPVALLSDVEESNYDDCLRAIKQARAVLAVNNTQENSVKSGRDRISQEEIETEIQAVRRNRQ